MATDINFGGINLAVPEGGNTDGLMGASHNMIYEDGALRPITLGEKVAEIDADYIYVHENGFRHYIALKAKDAESYTITAYDENFKLINTFDNTYDLPKSVTTIGNTVIVSANDKIYYFLWRARTSQYAFLGNEVPRVKMAFGLQGELLAKGYKATHLNFEGGQSAQDTFKIIGIFSLNTTTKVSTGLSFKKGTNYAFYASTSVGSLNKGVTIYGTDSSGNEKQIFQSALHGILYRHTWICDADYTNVSFTVFKALNYNFYIEEGATLSVDKTITVNEDNYTKALGIMNSFVNNNAIEKDKFIYPFFVRYAVKMYSGDYLYISPPVLMVPNSGYVPMTTYAQNKASDEIFAYAFITDLQYSIIESVSDDWADIISGVDIFVSQQLYCYNQGQEFNAGLDTLFTYDAYDKANSIDTVTNTSTGFLRGYFGTKDLTRNGYQAADLATALLDMTSLDYFLVFKTAPVENMEEKICNCGNFYHFKTIEFADLKESGREKTGNLYSRKMISIEPEEGTLTNLVTRRALTDDILSNRTIANGLLHSYNNRLHVYDATVKLPSPVPLQEQVAFQSNTAIHGDIAGVYVHLHTEEGDRCVAYEYDDTQSLDTFQHVVDNDGLCWFFYPDNQAYQVDILYHCDSFTEKYNKATLNLKQHSLLNGAYWYSGAMSGKSIFSNEADKENNTAPTISDTLTKPHTVYVSEANNPFVFSSKNVVSVGCSEIYKLSSAAKALSSGQFGQFPLYAFCDNGIWALETSTEGAYVARQPITRDVCNNINSVTQIDSGVVFSTARGIMCLVGSDTTCLSEALTERSTEMLDLPEKGVAVICNNVTCGTDSLTGYISFNDFIGNCHIAYDYTNKRLILTNGSTRYGYVYSFASGCWATMDTKLLKSDAPINSYPDAMYIGYSGTDSDKKTFVFNMSKRKFDGSQGGFGITRPLNLGNEGFKTINELAVRGAFARGAVRLLLFGSNDGRNWHIVSSSKTYKLQGYSGSPYKRFVLAVMTDLEYADYISGQTIDYMNRLNDKLR